MSVVRGNQRSEEFEHITNRDLVDSARMLMGSIDLDPASSKFANEYVGATEYYDPVKDGLNDQQWYGNVYLFPPKRSYFWDKKNVRWKATRGMSPTLCAGHAVWWRTLKRKWLSGEIEQAVYFTNYMDMAMYCQDIFDHPVCFLKQRPTLVRRYYSDDRVEKRSTGSSMIIYLLPKEDVSESTQQFVDIYSEKGRVLV